MGERARKNLGSAGMRSAAERARSEEIVIPLIAEEAVIGTRASEREAARIAKTVRTEERVVEIPVTEEEVRIDRVRVDREVDVPLPPWREDDTLVVPVMEQVPIVRMQWVVREEIRITYTTSKNVRSRKVRLSREEAVVRRNGREVSPGRQQSREAHNGTDGNRTLRSRGRGPQNSAGPGTRRVRPK